MIDNQEKVYTNKQMFTNDVVFKGNVTGVSVPKLYKHTMEVWHIPPYQQGTNYDHGIISLICDKESPFKSITELRDYLYNPSATTYYDCWTSAFGISPNSDKSWAKNAIWLGVTAYIKGKLLLMYSILTDGNFGAIQTADISTSTGYFADYVNEIQ